MEEVYSVPMESYDDRKLTNGASKLVQRSVQAPLAGTLSKVTPSAIPMSSDKSAASKLKTAKVAAVPKLSRATDPAQLKRADRPKTRLKVSGGTQTETSEPQRYAKSSRSKSPTSAARVVHAGVHSDSEYQPVGSSEKMFTYHPSVNGDSKLPFKSYSLTSPLANQLSQNVRERLANGAQSYSRSNAPFAVLVSRVVNTFLLAQVTSLPGRSSRLTCSPVFSNRTKHQRSRLTRKRAAITVSGWTRTTHRTLLTGASTIRRTGTVTSALQRNIQALMVPNLFVFRPKKRRGIGGIRPGDGGAVVHEQPIKP